MRRVGALAIVGAVACLGLAGCGGGTRANAAHPRGPITLLMARAPNSLDPAVGDTAEALEADWLVYTPLLTYDHADGLPGTQIIGGAATNLPVISDGGRTYTLTLQPGLTYSDGETVKASDFAWAVQRAIRLRWGGAPELITKRIVGAAAFAARQARTISGISGNDRTGQVTIHLTAPWGSFENVLALPAMAPVPRSTPLREEPDRPPPGIGPYEFGTLVPGRSFALVLNPRWRTGLLQGVPRGHVDVEVSITGDAQSNAAAVLDNRADVFDSADQIPDSLRPHIAAQAPARYSKQATNVTELIFMNTRRRPFTSQLTRVAVQTALDYGTLKRLGAGRLQEGCYLIPPSMWGHPHDQCPRGNIANGGDLAAARSLVARSGMGGTRITVWSMASSPVAGWMGYYTALLHRIGFQARLKLVSTANYYAAINRSKLQPQTGFGAFTPVLPTPLDFYARLSGPEENQNWSQVNDAYLNHQVGILGPVPSANLSAVADFWHGLDRYVADRAYFAVLGYETASTLVSDRIANSSVHLNPVTGLDWSSLRLK